MTTSNDFTTGDQMRSLVSRMEKRYSKGGNVNSGLAALKALAKKFAEALEMGDDAQARRIKRQMDLLDANASRALNPVAKEEVLAKEKIGTFSKGGKARKRKASSRARNGD